MSNDTNIKDFVVWCSGRKNELPVPAALIPKDKSATTSENRKRTGAKEGLYPELYFAGQYPSLWKIPAAADSMYYQSKGKK